MSSYFDRYEFPPLDQERLNVAHGQWSVFEREFTPDVALDFFNQHEPTYRERKGGVANICSDGMIEMPGHYIYLLGDSIPLEVLRALNGLDEAYDSGYGVNDICCGTRRR